MQINLNVLDNKSIRTRKTLVVFKVFNSTPEDLMIELFNKSNIFPIQNLFTKVVHTDSKYNGNYLNLKECLIYYRFSDLIPPKIEIPNILYVYRKDLDGGDYESIEYMNEYKIGNHDIKTLNSYHSKRLSNILENFLKDQ